jgi:Flp pilus assembly pilin Flp
LRRSLQYRWLDRPILTICSRGHGMFSRLCREEAGAALVEYAMLVGLIAAICVAGVSLIGQQVSGAFSSYAAALSVI